MQPKTNKHTHKNKTYVGKDRKDYEQIHRKQGKLITVTTYNVIIKIIRQENFSWHGRMFKPVIKGKHRLQRK